MATTRNVVVMCNLFYNPNGLKTCPGKEQRTAHGIRMIPIFLYFGMDGI